MECFAESRPTAHLKLDATRQRCTHTRQTIPDAAGLDAVGMAPLTRIRHVRAGALHSVEEFPGVRSIEVPDDYRLQERRFKITQVHSMASAGLGFERLPVGNDAADLAAHVSQRSIAPDVAFRVLGVALDRHRPERIVGPYSARAPAQRAVAAGGLVGRSRQHKTHRSAVAGALQRWCWTFVIHWDVPLVVVPPSIEVTGAARSGICVRLTGWLAATLHLDELGAKYRNANGSSQHEHECRA